MDQGQGRARRSGCPSWRSIKGRLGKSPKDLLAALHDDVRHRSGAVAAVGVRERAVRRGRAGRAAARDEAGGRGARHGVRGGVVLGAPGDPDAGSRQGAEVDRRRRRSSRPTGCSWKRRCAASRTRWAPARRRSPPRRARCERAGGEVHGVLSNADLPYPTIKLSTGESVRLDPSAYTLHRQSRVRADRDKVFASFFGALKTYERTMGATLAATVKAHLFEKRVRHFDTALEAALFSGQHSARRLQAAARRRAPQPADAAPLSGAAQAHAGPRRAALPGPLRAAGRQRRPALPPDEARADHPGRAGAAGQGVHGRAAQGVRQPLDRLSAVDGQAVGRVLDRRLRRAPVSAAELQRALRRPHDAGARVGALDAHVPVVRGRSRTRRPTTRSSSPRSPRRSTRTC